jgi:hypothetical protein
MVFARHTDDKLTSLVKALDKLVAADDKSKLRAVVHLVGGDSRDALEAKATEYGKKLALKLVPITVPTEYEAGPASWGLNPAAELTVFMYRENTVVSNHAFGEGEVKVESVKAILEDVPAKLLK